MATRTEALPASPARRRRSPRQWAIRTLLRPVLWWHARSTGPLNQQIRTFTARSLAFLPRSVREAIAAERASTRALGELAGALRAGDEAPSFSLPDHAGRRLDLEDLAAGGFAVIAFLRGGWCPACNLELRGLAKREPAFRELGARIAVVSPELPGRDSSFESMSPVEVPILVDRGNQVARAYGVAHRFGDTLRRILDYAGTDLAEHNGDDSFVLPIPAVYVIDRARRIRFAYVFGSYIDRVEPDELLDAMRALRA
jgi:peroxiredoxin